MDEATVERDDSPPHETGLNRRAFFGRALLLAGGTATVLTLSGCPGGGDGDDDDDDGDDDD
ncbi:hypothetical protein [Actinoplanes solisilvae]|uniref:hypothetical protein n=1 Tax=Actinoplanes solisilvae TaxID=2486853 RepID=UPI000FDA8E14|nr:hypothetical protein [Actinoplanes solisilvae]